MEIQILEGVRSEVMGVWFLIGAALVFWMQAGFAMVEAGFTRIKNTGNIIMKNLMDFCIGTVVFILIGGALLLGENTLAGFCGRPDLRIITDYSNFDLSGWIFNLVFCATTATIVSGAVAERTKFISYCVYSAVISAVVYPIEAHWIWGPDGWLTAMGFHDYAGSCAIHTVGGISALIGAIILGPRIGKFVKGRDGKISVTAFPGHNLTIGALGVFILWLGWYGFNGAAAHNAEELATIFVTTTIAPAVATLTCMIFTWTKYGKPDVSMCLNASLAGLVAVTASCDVADAAGAACIGAVGGLLVCFGVWFLDNKLRVDDPVGAVAVHMFNGIWGTIAVGLFATDSSPAFAAAGIRKGLFYGGGFTQLKYQFIGLFTVAAWTIVTMVAAFKVIDKIFGLRVSREEEIIGLDATEHGLPTAYGGFKFAPEPFIDGDVVMVSGDVPMAEAVEVSSVPMFDEEEETEDTAVLPAEVRKGRNKFTKVEIICRESRLEVLKNAMVDIGITGMTVTHVLGCGLQKGRLEYYRGIPVEASLLPKVQVDIVVAKVPVQTVIDTAKKVLYTGHIGDGKIFVYNVENVVKVRTGETGYDALQDVE